MLLCFQVIMNFLLWSFLLWRFLWNIKIVIIRKILWRQFSHVRCSVCNTYLNIQIFAWVNSFKVCGGMCTCNRMPLWAKTDDSIDSGNFSVRGYLPLIQKESTIHAWSYSLGEGRTSFCRNWSLENSADSYICFQLALVQSVSYFVFLHWSQPSSFYSIFYSFHQT